MALQLGALRDALINAGAEETLANKAAEEAAGYESRLASIETKLQVLQYMVGTILLLMLPVFWMLWNISAKVN